MITLKKLKTMSEKDLIKLLSILKENISIIKSTKDDYDIWRVRKIRIDIEKIERTLKEKTKWN